jgi:hypothetical protein
VHLSLTKWNACLGGCSEQNVPFFVIHLILKISPLHSAGTSQVSPEEEKIGKNVCMLGKAYGLKCFIFQHAQCKAQGLELHPTLNLIMECDFVATNKLIFNLDILQF